MPVFRLRQAAIGRNFACIKVIQQGAAMTPTPDTAIFRLETGQVISLDDAWGTLIRTRAGTVWVTEEGDIDDHIVGPGDARIVAHDGRTVVQALAPSWISIEVDAANDPTQTAA
jgi:hypothetical protein